ncbi:MAG: branched-chain amino acid ABC transporter permease [Candidatus Dormibacteria bacterium]
MGGWQVSFYIYTLVIFGCSFGIAALGLNLQYGLTGTLNFAYVLFYSIGAYIGGMVALGSQNTPIAQSLGEQFAFGLNLSLPYPLGPLVAALAGGVLAALVGLVLKRSLRDDFGALATVAIFLVAYTLAGALTPVFNGYNGIAGIPIPFGDQNTLLYVFVAVGWLALSFVLATALARSPYGRRMRAIREQPEAAEALGIPIFRTRITVFIVTNALAALAGAVLVVFVSGWSPLSWQFPETLVFFSAVIVGGRGNNLGAVVGAVLIGVALQQAVLFLPAIPSAPTLVPALQWVVTGVLTIAFLWFRPSGLLPERKTNWRSLEPLSARMRGLRIGGRGNGR